MARASSSTTHTRRRLLIADDNALMRKSLARLLKPACELILVSECAAAIHAVANEPILGVIADLVFPSGGDGFEIIQRARERDPHVPALLVTGFLDPQVAARAFAMDVAFLPKPLLPASVQAFAQRCLMHPLSVKGLVFDLAADWEARYHLTPTEREVLLATARGMSRDELLSARGIAETTLKRHVTNLLLKTGEASLDRAALRFLREALREID